MSKKLTWEHARLCSNAYEGAGSTPWGTVSVDPEIEGWRADWLNHEQLVTNHYATKDEAIQRVNEVYAEMQNKPEPVEAKAETGAPVTGVESEPACESINQPNAATLELRIYWPERGWFVIKLTEGGK